MKTFFHYMLALMMLVTGSINTLTVKAADRQTSIGSTTDGYTNEPRPFVHPFLQAWFMFMGEVLCLIAFNLLLCRVRGTPEEKRVDTAKPFNRLLLALPAMCDMCATSFMYVGLTLTYASVFQMLRGSVVIFTGVLSVFFLKRKLWAFHWVGMALVLVGTGVVGTASYACHTTATAEAPNPPLGNVIIILAQVIVAGQMVLEERLIGGLNLPALQVVGWEGTWGMLVLGVLLVPMYFLPQPTEFNTNHVAASHFEDAVDGLRQMFNSGPLTLFLMGNVLSIAFYNFSGVSVTRYLNASTRMVLDSLRTVVIWAVSLALGWQSFCYVEVIGFLLLLGGSVVYNDIVRLPYLQYPAEEEDSSPAAKAKREAAGGVPLLGDSDEETLSGSLNTLGTPGDPALGTPSPLLPSQEVLLTPSMGRATAVKQR